MNNITVPEMVGVIPIRWMTHLAVMTGVQPDGPWQGCTTGVRVIGPYLRETDSDERAAAVHLVRNELAEDIKPEWLHKLERSYGPETLHHRFSMVNNHLRAIPVNMLKEEQIPAEKSMPTGIKMTVFYYPWRGSTNSVAAHALKAIVTLAQMKVELPGAQAKILVDLFHQTTHH